MKTSPIAIYLTFTVILNLVSADINFSHWEINTLDTSIVDDEGQGPLIKLQFNISNRNHSTQVLQDDCETDFTGLAESGISLINAPITSPVTSPVTRSLSANTVTCKLTMDNVVLSVYYNGVDITDTVQGNLGVWQNVKTIDFVAVADATLVVYGREESNVNNCQLSGFLMECTATDGNSAWNGLTTGSEGWRAYAVDGPITDSSILTGENYADDFLSSICTSTSPFYLWGASSSTRKIWAAGAADFAAFAMNPDDIDVGEQSGQFIQYDSLIKVNHTVFITNDTYWTNISDTLGFMEICVLTELYLDETEPKETVNFLSNLINITYDTDGNFKVLDIDVTRTGPEESEVAVDYSTYLEAYQCTQDNLSDKNTQTYSQGSVLVVCVKGDRDIVAVEAIKQLSVKQGSNAPFEYISDSDVYNSAIVKTDCEEVDSNFVCFAQLRLLGRFFSSNTPEKLEVTGAVTMTFLGNGDRRLSRPLFVPGQHNNLERSRYLQDVSDSGAFNVEVELEKIEDSVKSQSILSGHTKYYLSSVALCYVFGLLWYIV